ncbi:MAG: SMP-30/gluconolactonase/LRE family protein [Alphaproteobacteria bacterium]
MTEVRCVLDIRAELGECPVWCVRDQVLWWVDILKPALNRFNPKTGLNDSWPMPEDIGCFALREQGGVVAALRSGFHFVDVETGEVTKIVDPDLHRPHTRFNDGKCDPQGRFWAGTLYELKDKPAAALYRLDPDGTTRRMAGEVVTANGLAFSTQDKRMYWSDSRAQKVWIFDYDDATGGISNRRIFLEFKPDEGRPDGAAIDTEGCYWSALYEGNRIARFKPSGQLDYTIPMPVRCPTMIAFGGEDFKTLYITSLRENRSPDELKTFPQSGSIFAVRVDVPGLPEPRFRG